MKVHNFKTIQKLPITVSQAWDFLSNPKNLQKITPTRLDFNITNEFAEKMHAGMLITYTLKPLFNQKVTWVTEITHVNEPHLFIDEQRFGPYRLWHHQHLISELPNGVEMTDIVHYVIPFGFIGNIANELIVKKELNDIFEFRRKALISFFGEYKD